MQNETIAAFDFDGTLSKRDTFIPFALFVVGPWCWLKGFASLIPSIAGFLMRQITRQELKERTIEVFLGGLAYENLQNEGKEFAVEIVPKLLKRKALKQLSWHQEQGHRVVLVSASPEVYLIPWAEMMGIDHVCASRLELDANGRVTGKLNGMNCRGAEKVRRLQELLGKEKTYELYAYGDSRGDKEMLAFADHPFFRKI